MVMCLLPFLKKFEGFFQEFLYFLYINFLSNMLLAKILHVLLTSIATVFTLVSYLLEQSKVRKEMNFILLPLFSIKSFISSYFSELSIHLPALYEYKGYSFIISDSKYFK